ncbi:DUF4362 domain-containing protein [Paenibacillus antri]|nr:DUF4362 domain-containing protein [Paenibacillus antri]
MRKLLGSLVAAVVAMTAAGCSTSEPAVAPLDEGDIVHSGIGPEEASNLERFDAFLAVTASGGNDAVRIVDTTIEGDPIYTDISYAEGKYVVVVDNSEDAFASESARKREKTAECTELVQTDRPDEFHEYACGTYKFMVKDF